MSAGEKLVTTYEEYLAQERESPVKMQLVDGVAYAMAGGAHQRMHSSRRRSSSLWVFCCDRARDVAGCSPPT